MTGIVKKIGKGVKKLGKALKKGWKKVTSSTIGKVALTVAAIYLGGLALGAFAPGGATAAAAAPSAATGGGALTGAGTLGASGAAGAAGAAGASGAAGTAGSALSSLASGAKALASSPVGQAAIAGGVQAAFTPDEMDLLREEDRLAQQRRAQQQMNLDTSRIQLGVRPGQNPYASGLIRRNMA